jgi:Coenzyme PQQ synthesis protein D (PqqD)
MNGSKTGNGMMLHLDARYRRSGNVVSRKIHDEVLLVPIKDNVGDLGCIYSLNGVGAFIWELIDGERSLLDIQHEIVEEFEVASEEAERDLRDFVDDLYKLGAITAV